uniref:Cytochrome c6 n=1 Tax=Caloglossa intermedia TaxID=100879 RepID=A0A1Z1M675_9FLOR|nr:cytochrome c553 [Caloglossa intermedia]ARW61363.1 cytochrome c553 [Caloglossa intermedia]
MSHLLRFLVLCQLLLLFSVKPSLAQDIEAGQQIFSQNCTACHAGGNNVISPEKTLKKEMLEQYEMNSVQAITNQVTNGKNAMPAFGGRLSDDDINNVANYVLNQSEAGW